MPGTPHATLVAAVLDAMAEAGLLPVAEPPEPGGWVPDHRMRRTTAAPIGRHRPATPPDQSGESTPGHPRPSGAPTGDHLSPGS